MTKEKTLKALEYKKQLKELNGKTNELPAVLTVFVVFAGGALFGFTGIVIAVPLTIILMAIIKTYKPEIEKGFKKIIYCFFFSI